MAERTVFFADGALAARCRGAVEAAGASAVALEVPRAASPADARPWARAASEMALYQWLLVMTPQAAEAVLEACGAPPANTLRVAAVGDSDSPLSEMGRPADLGGPGLRETLWLLKPALGRRQRVLVPHAATGGRKVGAWLSELGADPTCVPAYTYAADAEVGAAVTRPRSVAAVIGSPHEAEFLRWALDLRSPDTAAVTSVAVLDGDGFDAAQDCGFTSIRRIGDRLGSFLDETLS